MNKLNKYFTIFVLSIFCFSLAFISLSPLYNQYKENKVKKEELNLFSKIVIKKYNLNEKEILKVKQEDEKQFLDFLNYIKKCEELEKDKICKKIIPINNF